MNLSSDFRKNIKLDGFTAKLIKQNPNSFENSFIYNVIFNI